MARNISLNRLFALLLTLATLTITGVGFAGNPLSVATNVYLVGSGTVQSGTRYEMRNSWSQSALIYEKQNTGINLGWGRNTNGVRLVKAAGGVVKYGDTIAFGVSNGFLQYDSRRFGINLKWTSGDKPVYEWVVKGGPNGQPVQLGKPIIIENTKEHDHVMYCIRTKGGAWVKWAKTCSQSDRALTYANAKR